MRSKSILVVLLIILLMESPLEAGIIVQDQKGSGWQILSYFPIGQTFTCEDAGIQSIGFGVFDFNPQSGPIVPVTVTLYEGIGVTEIVVGSADLWGLTAGFDDFYDADFSSVTLQIGKVYSAVLSTSNARAGVWGRFWINEWGEYLQPDPYPGGEGFSTYPAGEYDLMFRILPIPEPATPPVADADGPYSIYVGDTLTLDASGSTDADDDIVSYMWDLDGNGSFETDAGSQAIFDVNYTYLQSLELIVDHTYNIHVKVTDSKGQSDIAGSTLIIVPKPAVEVAVDIKPGSCPNPVDVKSSGVLPIAILGSEDFDVTTIDIASIRLAGVEPLRSGYEDVAGPVSDSNDCNCITEGPDGFLDLTLKFKTQRIVEAIGDVNDGDVRVLTLTGVLFDPMPFEMPIEGADCILIRGRHKPINPADINKDGVVNAADFAIFAQNWLQSSIVDE